MEKISARSYALLLAVLLTVLAISIQWSGGLQRWNNIIFDQQGRIFSNQAENSEIVLVVIDDRSLESLGRWPWSRSIHAEFIENLTAAEIRAVGFDILFVEPDIEEPEADLRLAEAIKNNGRVVLPAVVEIAQNQSDVKMNLPIPEFAEAAAKLGYVNIYPDAMGIVRGLFLTVNINSSIQIPAFAKALWETGQVIHDPNTIKAYNASSSLNNPPPLASFVRIPVSKDLPDFQTFSYVDVLRSEKLRKRLYDKYLLVGLNATGLGTKFATSILQNGTLISGVEFNAQVLNMLMKDNAISALQPGWAIALTGILVFIPIYCFGFIPVRSSMLISLIFILLSLSISAYILQDKRLWFEPVAAVGTIFLGYLLWAVRHLEFISQLLFTEKAKAMATLQAIGDAVVTTDTEGGILFMNPAAERISGFSSANALGRKFEKVFNIQDTEECKKLLDLMTGNSLFADSINQVDILCLINKKGEKYAIQLAVNSVIDRLGKVAGKVYAMNDLTDFLSVSQKMAHIATHDALTELPNRVLLQDRLTQAINLAQRSGKHIAILFIDLDGFKKVNDGLGHSGGDLLLKEVAERLQSSVRQVDTTARWGGDEFVILLENLNHADYIVEIAEKIVQLMSRPFTIFSQDVFVTPSIGISLFPKDGETADALLARADAAMYSVKDSGRNAFSFYSKGLNESARGRLEMEKELHQALLNEDFEIYYQPQINLKSHQIIGAEALIRWRHKDKGMILPDDFISLAEDIGLIVPIGEWLIKTVCQQIQFWHERKMPEIHVAVNLSPRQFLQSNLVEMITQLIHEYEIPQGVLGVEVTESMMMKDIDKVVTTLQQLKNIGVSVAVDDFGTGYSSLSYLKRFPIDKLKIDKSFIKNIFANADDANIVQAVIVLGQKMNMQIIAEGVETRDQLLFLKRHDCDIGQGYYFEKPLKADKLSGLLLEKQVLIDIQ